MIEVKVPSPGESINQVQLASWLVSDGDYVEKDQEIAEIDSDKATLAIPSPEAGVIKIITAVGETIAIGAVICTLDTAGTAPAPKIEQPTTIVAKAPSPLSPLPPTSPPPPSPPPPPHPPPPPPPPPHPTPDTHATRQPRPTHETRPAASTHSTKHHTPSAMHTLTNP
ncbi:MAG: lipoyl domain-containing protein, partial [Bacteroidota bacterium]